MNHTADPYLLTFPSSVPLSFSYAGSQNHGSFTSTRPCIDTSTCSNELDLGVQLSLLSPCHVPRMLKQILPSSYRFGLTRPFDRVHE